MRLFARIIRDPASSTEVCIRVFMNLCKSPFLITCLLASFAAEVYSLFVTPRKRAAGSAESLAFKATWTKKQLAESRANLDRVKGCFLRYH